VWQAASGDALAGVGVDAGPKGRAGETVQTGQQKVQSGRQRAQHVPGHGRLRQDGRRAAREAPGDGQRAPESGEQGFGTVQGEGPFHIGAFQREAAHAGAGPGAERAHAKGR
jgi:hypothetical protein